MSEVAEKRPSAWRRFWRGVWLFILWLIRLILAIGGGVLLGWAIFYVAYYGVPQFYSQVLNPIQVNSARLDIVQSDLRSTQASFADDLRVARAEIRALQSMVNDQVVVIHTLQAELQAERANREQLMKLLQADVKQMDETLQFQSIALGELQGALEKNKETLSGTISNLSADLQGTRKDISALSMELVNKAESIANLQGDLSDLQMDLSTQVSALRDDLSKSLDNLQSRLTAAQEDLKNNAEAVGTLSQEVEVLKGNLFALSQSAEDMENELLGIRQIITMPITLSSAFERRLVLMQAWQGILKARLHLLEKNAGYAGQSLGLARANVDKFIELSTDIPADAFAQIQSRLDTVDTLLENDPFVAAQELEIIWHNLEQLVVIPVASGETAASPEAPPAAETPAPLPAEAAPTETPVGTPQPSPTPTPSGG